MGIQISISDSVLQAIRLPEQRIEQELRQELAIALYTQDLLSLLLNQILAWEADDTQEAIEGIKQGLEDFEQGRFRDFEQFAEEQYNRSF
jgi:predicted HTH domain antitoxin